MKFLTSFFITVNFIFIQNSPAYEIGFVVGKLISYLVVIGIVVGLIILFRRLMNKKK